MHPIPKCICLCLYLCSEMYKKKLLHEFCVLKIHINNQLNKHSMRCTASDGYNRFHSHFHIQINECDISLYKHELCFETHEVRATVSKCLTGILKRQQKKTISQQCYQYIHGL